MNFIWLLLLICCSHFSFQDSGVLNMTLAVIHDPPYVIVQNSTTGELHLSGLDVEAFEIVAKHLGINYRVMLIKGGYGELQPNGTWTGLLGVIQRKEADVCLPSLSATPLRCQQVDISAPISSSYSRFLARRPSSTVEWNHYLAPFSPSIWLITLIFLFGCSFLTAVAIWLNDHLHFSHTYCSILVQYFEYHWHSSIWSCICFISQRGNLLTHTKHAGTTLKK